MTDKTEVCPSCLSKLTSLAKWFPLFFMCEVCEGEGRVRYDIARAWQHREIKDWRCGQ